MINQKYSKVKFSEIELDDEFDHCKFIDCDFVHAEIRKTVFSNCRFCHCDLTMTKFFSSLRDVQFEECKMMGTDFSHINRFSGGFEFRACMLRYCSFIALKLKATRFRKCQIVECYFDDSDMKESVFDDCDLSGTSFDRVNLEKADFSSSYNYSINPLLSRLKKTIFSQNGLRGLVSHLDIVIEE